MFWSSAKKSNQADSKNSLYQCRPDLGRAPVLITLLAADTQLVEKAIKRHARARSYLPVFVTSDVGLSGLLAVGAITEYLPSAIVVMRFADAGNWELYLTERWRLLIAKWRPAYTARYGASFEEYLDLCKKHVMMGPLEAAKPKV